DIENRLVDRESGTAHQKYKKELIAARETCTALEDHTHADEVVHQRRQGERHCAHDHVVPPRNPRAQVEQTNVYNCGNTPDEEVFNDLHRNQLYLMMQYIARNPSFQPIFLPSS